VVEVAGSQSQSTQQNARGLPASEVVLGKGKQESDAAERERGMQLMLRNPY
jgi:hypothetical protein